MAEPLEVEYHPVSGIPPEYCEYSTKAEFEKDIPWLLENRDTAWLTANCKNFKEYFQDEKSTEVEEKLKELAVTGEPLICNMEPRYARHTDAVSQGPAVYDRTRSTMRFTPGVGYNPPFLICLIFLQSRSKEMIGSYGMKCNSHVH
jgi:hypothetical protein